LMNNSISRVGIAILSALFWIIIIFFPQESESEFVIWAAMYYFPFYLFGLLLVSYLLKIDFLIPVNLFFHNKWALVANTIVLFSILIISWTNHFHEISLLIFFTNFASFCFSVFIYYLFKK
jgi:hypothetical protein